jgi:hypothetical protein
MHDDLPDVCWCRVHHPPGRVAIGLPCR